MGGLAAANILTAEAGMFIGIVALALWLLKVTVSTYWLTVIGEIARAIAGAVIQVTTALGLLMLAVPIGVFAGVVTIKRGEAGPRLDHDRRRADHACGLGGDLQRPRRADVRARRAARVRAPHRVLGRLGRHPQRCAGRLRSGQVDTLTASLITRTVREPLQLWNFGHVVDRVGGCGAAWSAAVGRGESDGPIRAMAACGDRARRRLRPAPRRHQHLGRMRIHPRRRAAGVVHDRLRLGCAAGVGHGDLDHRHRASRRCGSARYPVRRNGAR